MSTLKTDVLKDVAETVSIDVVDLVGAIDLRQDLADDIDPLNGSGQIGHRGRTVRERLDDTVYVTDYEVVAGGLVDNTAAYAAMVAELPEGTKIIWPFGTYLGDFVSTKSFVLDGGGSTLIGVAEPRIISIEGSVAVAQALGAAPAYGDTALTGVSGLTEDALLLLYSGQLQPSTAFEVNHEVVKVRSDGSLYGKVYGDHNGGTPTYAVVTPVADPKVENFKLIQATGVPQSGVFIRYALNPTVNNISMDAGERTTVDIRVSHGTVVTGVRRIKPSDTGSGNGYNVALNTCKWSYVSGVYGEETRHDFDQDSSYETTIEKVKSLNCKSSSVVLAHTGFGGATTLNDCYLQSNTYGVNTSSQGAASPNDLLFRVLKLSDIRIDNSISMTTSAFWVGVYLQYPTESVKISGLTIKNTNDEDLFDYAATSFNDSYHIIRAYEPRKGFYVNGVDAIAATTILWCDNTPATEIDGANLHLSNPTITYFRDIVRLNLIGSDVTSNLTIEDLRFYDSASKYGRSIVSTASTTNRLNKMVIRGINKTSAFTSIINFPATLGVGRFSIVDTGGFGRRAAGSLNSLAPGGTITQKEYLDRGDFAVWTAASVTLSAVTPISRPVTSGNIFAIHNGGIGTMTIPANSDTVDNTVDILIAPNETHYFQSNSAGTKWNRYKVETGNSL